MQRQKNIFYKIVKDENDFTELLCNMFRFPEFRVLFENIIKEKININSFSFKYEDVVTQCNINGYGIPDLVIRNNKNLILIENKIDNTGLTQNQNYNYAEYLKKQTSFNKILLYLYIIPQSYIYLGQIEKIFSDNKKFFYSTIIFWEEIIEKIKETKLNKLNIIFQDFYQFLKEWFIMPDIIFTEEELMILKDKDLPTAITKILQQVDNVYKILGKRLLTIKEKRNYTEYGIYISGKGKECLIWFGIWFKFWEHSGKPFSIGVNKEMANNNKELIDYLNNKLGAEYIDYDKEQFFYAIDSVEFEGENNIIDLLLKINSAIT